MGHLEGNRVVIVTGAGGHIGNELCHLLKATGNNLLPVDVCSSSGQDLIACELTNSDEVARLGVLPSYTEHSLFRGSEKPSYLVMRHR